MRATLLSLVAIAAAAQDQTGRIEGVVLDAISHQPVKKAAVSVNFMGSTPGQTQVQNRQGVVTDASGAFAFNGLPAGRYQLTVMHQSYPQARMGGVRKNVQVSPSATAARVTVELVPGATVGGRIVDEDGDPLSGCNVRLHSAKSFNQGVPMTRVPLAGSDGSYRLVNIPPGKYIVFRPTLGLIPANAAPVSGVKPNKTAGNPARNWPPESRPLLEKSTILAPVTLAK